jgi:hypothetical protein
MHERWASAVPCRDRADRNRLARVIVNEKGEVVLIAPPGEVAIFDPSEVNAVKQAMADAQVEAIHVRRGRFT